MLYRNIISLIDSDETASEIDVNDLARSAVDNLCDEAQNHPDLVLPFLNVLNRIEPNITPESLVDRTAEFLCADYSTSSESSSKHLEVRDLHSSPEPDVIMDVFEMEPFNEENEPRDVLTIDVSSDHPTLGGNGDR